MTTPQLVPRDELVRRRMSDPVTWTDREEFISRLLDIAEWVAYYVQTPNEEPYPNMAPNEH